MGRNKGKEPAHPRHGPAREHTAMRRSEAAVALIRREEGGQILWLAQWNPKWQAYHFISGHRRPEETFRECLVREVHEELGLAEGVDYTAAAHLGFQAFSQGAGVETQYTME